MFGNVQRIIHFHRNVFTTDLSEANGRSEKVYRFIVYVSSKKTFYVSRFMTC